MRDAWMEQDHDDVWGYVKRNNRDKNDPVFFRVCTIAEYRKMTHQECLIAFQQAKNRIDPRL